MNPVFISSFADTFWINSKSLEDAFISWEHLKKTVGKNTVSLSLSVKFVEFQLGKYMHPENVQTFQIKPLLGRIRNVGCIRGCTIQRFPLGYLEPTLGSLMQVFWLPHAYRIMQCNMSTAQGQSKVNWRSSNLPLPGLQLHKSAVCPSLLRRCAQYFVTCPRKRGQQRWQKFPGIR